MVRISNEAEELLLAAIDSDGYVVWSRTIGAETIRGGQKTFWPPPGLEKPTPKDVEMQARWIGAVEDLRKARLVRGSLDRWGGGVFWLSREGWQYGRDLRQGRADG